MDIARMVDARKAGVLSSAVDLDGTDVLEFRYDAHLC